MNTFIALYCLAMLSSVAYASCDSPRYHHIGSLKFSTGLLRVVIDPRDLTIAKASCLTTTLKQQHPEWQHVTVLIFTAMSDARHFSPGPRVELPTAADKAQSNVHLMYEFDRNKRSEKLDILPYGWRTDVSDSTEIGLPLEGAPHCRFEMVDRCLVGLESNFDYPQPALAEHASGTITLTGTTTPLGSIEDIQVKAAAVPSDRVRQALIDSSIHNFSTWQFEAKGDRTSLELVYVYDIGQSPVNDRFRVRLVLPKVLIDATP